MTTSTDELLMLGSARLKKGGRPYVIAEIGVNHEGSIDTARRLIDLAKEGGANAAKFQTYKAGRITAKQSPAYWDTSKESTQSQYLLFQKYDAFGPDEYEALHDHCDNVGIDFMSTAFDLDAFKYIDPLVKLHKIASADITNIPLLRLAAAAGKPILLSTGAANLDEIELAVAELKGAGAAEIILLQCTLNYPCPIENANLNMIEGLSDAFPDHWVGYSDHTPPDADLKVLFAAWLKGAIVLEKHFTHDKTLPGNDHYHAMDMADLKRFLAAVDAMLPILGARGKHALPDEQLARDHARRSIVIDGGVRANDVLGGHNLVCKRPAHGISPVHWDEVVGRKVIRDLEDDHILQWEDLA